MSKSVQSVQSAPLTHLGRQGCVHGTFGSVLGAPFVRSAAWDDFADSWNYLGQDRHMADGGTYRRRRYSEFAYTAADDRIALLPHVPYFQPENVNYLNGGVERHYEPFEERTANSPALLGVYRWCVAAMTEIEGPRDWKIQTFQNRILAREGEIGQPTPEGVHRDGVDYVLTLLVGRKGVDGGESSVYDAATRERVSEVLLTEPGEFLFADDERLLHGVTPLTPATPGVPGHRDVLIVMFTRAN